MQSFTSIEQTFIRQSIWSLIIKTDFYDLIFITVKSSIHHLPFQYCHITHRIVIVLTEHLPFIPCACHLGFYEAWSQPRSVTIFSQIHYMTSSSACTSRRCYTSGKMTNIKIIIAKWIKQKSKKSNRSNSRAIPTHSLRRMASSASEAIFLMITSTPRWTLHSRSYGSFDFNVFAAVPIGALLSAWLFSHTTQCLGNPVVPPPSAIWTLIQDRQPSTLLTQCGTLRRG